MVRCDDARSALYKPLILHSSSSLRQSTQAPDTGPGSEGEGKHVGLYHLLVLTWATICFSVDVNTPPNLTLGSTARDSPVCSGLVAALTVVVVNSIALDSTST